MTVEPTLGEVMRRLDELSLEVRAIPLRIDETYLRRDVYSADSQRIETTMNHMVQRLEKMESRAEWTVRTVGFLVISAVIGIAIQATQYLSN